MNLSAAELRDPNLIAGVRAVLEADRAAAGGARAGDHGDRAARRRRDQRRPLRELRSLGVRIALDDFGTGYSSLSYLHSLPLDSLKIAKPFVDGLVGDGREASFIGVIVELARKLELDVIAEGIETPAQLRALRELGVELGQGFLVGRPAAAGHRATSAGRAGTR